MRLCPEAGGLGVKGDKGLVAQVVCRLLVSHNDRNNDGGKPIDNRFFKAIFRREEGSPMMYSKNTVQNAKPLARPRTKVMTRYTPESASGLHDT